MSDNLQTLEKLLEMVNTKKTLDDFLKAFESIVTIFENLKETNANELENIRTLFEKLKKQVEDDAKNDLTEIKDEVSKTVSKQIKTIQDKLSEVDAKLATVQNGENGEDGKDADEEAIIASVLAQMPPDVEETPQQTRDKLESLKGTERLDKAAIRGIEVIEQDIKEIKLRPIQGLRGGKGIGLYVGGNKKLLTAQTLNLIAGTGVTISYSYANGRNDITISASGSASLTPITVTGTVDDSNTSFTAASTPNIVIVNGASYRHGHGCTISGLNITLDNPVGAGGDIYCL